MRIPEGGEFPRGYGIAYREIETHYAVVYPFPFNHIVGWWRDSWFTIRHRHREITEYERSLLVRELELKRNRFDLLRHAYNLGLKHGAANWIHELKTGEKNRWCVRSHYDILGAVLNPEDRVL